MKLIPNKNTPWINMVYCIMIIVVVISISILASVPPVDRDALTHHLYVPKLYLQHGGIYEIPSISFSYYPMNLDLLYLIPMYFNNDIVPKFIHFAFALITAAMIYRYLVRRLNQQYALLGGLFFLSLPVIFRLSSTVYVDLGLICFFFASLLYLFRWIENNFRIKYLIISAMFCGLALGTKYNGLVGLFLLGLFVPFVYSRYHAGEKSHGIKAIGYSAAFVLISLLVFSPWMIRNIVWTGNPVYPLYNSVFNPQKVTEKPVLQESAPEETISEEKHPRMSHIDTRKIIYGESWLQIALIPFRVFYDGQDDTPKYFDGKTSPFLLLLTPFAFFGLKTGTRQEKTEKMILLFFSILFLLYACAQTSIRIRYFSPILPPLVVLSMYGLHNIRSLITENRRFSEPIKMTIFFALIAVMLGLNANYMISRFKQDQPMAYITGKVTRDEYIQAFRPEYASFQYANQNLPKDSKILGLYLGNRGYYSNIDISFNIEFLQQLAAKAVFAQDVSEKLHEKNFTHLLVNFSLFNYWVQHYSLHEKQILKDFFDQYVVTEFSKDGYGLLRLKEVSREQEAGSRET
jgi:4-amino-4-deoxy-L-arabinose transferase-like glycosyltransferase